MNTNYLFKIDQIETFEVRFVYKFEIKLNCNNYCICIYLRATEHKNPVAEPTGRH